MKKRQIQEFIQKNNGDGILLLSSVNRYWYLNFKSSFGLLFINKDNKGVFITDSRYINAANQKIKDSDIEIVCTSFNKTVPDLINYAMNKLSISKLIIEEDYLSLKDYNLIKKYNCIPVQTNWLRVTKSDEEVEKLQRSADIICEVLNWLYTWIKPGISEKEVAKMISIKILELGAQENSFSPIVAAGKNGACPHHEPSDYIIQDGDMVTIDLGCMLDNYASDMTRTIVVGKECNEPEMLEIYEIVKKAQSMGLESSKKSAYTSDVDLVCRNYIDSTKYKGLFGHGTGHGVGIEVHETPVVSLYQKTILENNQVITIEPGIYKEGLGGVRIEDTVVIKDEKPLILTNKITKELLFINNK